MPKFIPTLSYIVIQHIPIAVKLEPGLCFIVINIVFEFGLSKLNWETGNNFKVRTDKGVKVKYKEYYEYTI